MTPFITAGAGFLLAVLWFDLMFDVQLLAHRGGEVPEQTLASICGYYRRVTTAARPMNRLIAAVMVLTLSAIAVEIARAEQAVWVHWSSLALAAAPILLAATRTVPGAVRLGTRADTPARQGELARSILREHVFCALSVTALLALQLASV